MCVRELNFRLLLRGLRADSLFAYRSKSSRVSVRSSAFSAAWSDGVLWLLRAAMCVRELNFRLLLRGLEWNGLLPFGEYVASSGLLILASPQQARAFQNFGLFSTGSSPVRALLYRYFHFI